MSLNKIRNGIVNRAAKVKEMRFKFEPEERVKQYQETSLKILTEDYLAEVQCMRESDRGRLLNIEERYRKQQPSLTERSQRLALTQNELRSLSLPQLKKRAEDARSFPPILTDINECQAIASELRSRNAGDASDEADALSGWVQAQRVGEPWTHDADYQRISKRIEKFGVYDAQCAGNTMIILSDDPDHIAQSDCITFESLDKAEVSS